MEKKFPFEFNKLYELWMNSEYIQLQEETIKIIIKSIITEYVLSGRGMKSINVVSLLNGIQWQWMTNSGSLSKRIGKWLKQNYNIAISPELSTAIGNTARKFLLKNQTYHFDFADKVKWNAGDFGDHDSCFWSGLRDRHEILKRISNNDHMFAVRLFKKHSTASGFSKVPDNVYYADNECYYTGISRAWASVDEHEGSRIYTLFNGYGLTTTQIAALVSNFLGMSTQHLAINNNNDVEGDLYFNSYGIAIGDNSIIKNLLEYNVNIDGSTGGIFYEKEMPKKEKSRRDMYLEMAGIQLRTTLNKVDPQPKLIRSLRTGEEYKAKSIQEIESALPRITFHQEVAEPMPVDI